MDSGAGDDVINVVIFDTVELPGGELGIIPVGFSGTVEYSAEMGHGNDTWKATVLLTAGSDGLFTGIDVFFGEGNDTLDFGFLFLGHVSTPNLSYDGGDGEYLFAYTGPPPAPELFQAVRGFESFDIEIALAP